MPLSLEGDNSSLPVYGSGRDVGNIAAGLVAARSGMSWATARLGFDGLQSVQQLSIVTESSSTQYGQKLGHRIGSQIYQKYIQSRNPGSAHLRNVKVSNQIYNKDE